MRAKLVQVYEALQNFGERDAERDELLALYSQQKADGNTPDRYCRDEFTVGDRAVQAFERLFHLDEYRAGGAHRSLSFYKTEPPYNVVKSAAQDILRQT